MATKLLHVLPIFSLLLILAATTTTVSARPGRPFHPCNTLIISTYSFTLQNPNPNPTHGGVIFMNLHPIRHLCPRHHPRFFLSNNHHHLLFPQFPRIPVDPLPNADTIPSDKMTDLPFLGLSSFRDRTKDILSVVASLLFGAACGALTAGTMYLIWSLLNFRNGSNYRSLDDGFTSDDDDDDDNDDEDIFNPKKPHNHYVPIPASPVKEAVKVADAAAPTVAKETA